MVQYALKRARVWGLYSKTLAGKEDMTGLLICQPPYETGVSVAQMVKCGFAMAPLKMGMAALSRVLILFDQSERVHNQYTKDIPHWYINCIVTDPNIQNKNAGSGLIDTVLSLADAQKVHVYTDTASEDSLRFFERHGFKIVHNAVNSATVSFWALMREPKTL
eukprot:gene18875-22577_t